MSPSPVSINPSWVGSPRCAQLDEAVRFRPGRMKVRILRDGPFTLPKIVSSI